MQKSYKSNKVEMQFYFPEESNLKLVPQKILDMTVKSGMNNYLGYMTNQVFLQDYSHKLGTNKSKLVVPTEKEIIKIRDEIFKFVDKFNRILKLKYDVRFFIFPWCPSSTDSKKFVGVNATATYYGTIHLYIDLKSYTKKGLMETLAHELNHIKFYENYDDLNLTIQQHLVTEGLAECFRKYMVGGKVAPWSKAFSEKRVLRELKKIQPILLSKDREIFSDLFYGGKKFKRWTGYTIGYYLVKRFLKKNKKMTWEKIMKMDTKLFFE